jgi:hypothetical protein
MIVICKRIFLLSACMMILSALVPNASAQQSATAIVNGTVKDSNGALLTGA